MHTDPAHQATMEQPPVAEDFLITMAQAGQRWAFAELSRRNYSRLYRSIYRVTRDCEDAEDALQDSMLKAFRHIGQFDGRSSFATWLTRIGINSALMILRKKRIRQETSMDTVEEATPGLLLMARRLPNPEQIYVARERSLRLQRALTGLPQNLRSVVELRKTEGQSLKEIARSMNISVPAAKSRLARARTELRKAML